MSIPINQIVAFTTVARTASFAEAAVQLHLSQPALSIAIKNLENSLGGKLLQRTTRTVSLSPEGKAFYPVARRLLDDYEQSLQDVRNHFALLRGKLDVAAMPTYATNLLPDIFSAFHKRHPDIGITVHDVIAESVIEMVREERCEFGISFDPGDIPELDFEHLYTDRFMAILPHGHTLLTKPKLTWQDILSYPQVSLQRPASTRLLIDKALTQEGLAFSPIFESHQLVSVGKMVTKGLGLSVVPSTSKNQMLEMGLVCRDLGSPEIVHKVGIVTRRRASLSTAAHTLLGFIRDHN